MKTKIALLVTIFAAALFGMGCAGVPKPDVVNAVKWKGHWYALFDDKAYTITEAREKAKMLDGHLPYINSKEEEVYILKMVK